METVYVKNTRENYRETKREGYMCETNVREKAIQYTSIYIYIL